MPQKTSRDAVSRAALANALNRVRSLAENKRDNGCESKDEIIRWSGFVDGIKRAIAEIATNETPPKWLNQKQ